MLQDGDVYFIKKCNRRRWQLINLNTDLWSTSLFLIGLGNYVKINFRLIVFKYQNVVHIYFVKFYGIYGIMAVLV